MPAIYLQQAGNMNGAQAKGSQSLGVIRKSHIECGLTVSEHEPNGIKLGLGLVGEVFSAEGA